MHRGGRASGVEKLENTALKLLDVDEPEARTHGAGHVTSPSPALLAAMKLAMPLSSVAIHTSRDHGNDVLPVAVPPIRSDVVSFGNGD
ncbi:hypothetical protein L1887_50611 [Cichorium endivia]|nr:hypothetical protein L1887_50611 [Cichorium endivia]